jgi:hypothetical protein
MKTKLILLPLLLLTTFAYSQNRDSAQKVEAIITRAIQSLGGEKYLSLRTVTSRGYFTPIDKIPGIPNPFIDYLVYPDKERTEFKLLGNKVIQTYAGQKGWIYDGAARTVRDAKPSQLEDFKITQRTSIENLLRGWYRKENATLTYLGRRESGTIGRRNEAIQLTYPDGFIVDFEFDQKDGLPVKILYKRKDPEREEPDTEEVRIAQYVNFDSIKTPLVVDHFKNGTHTSRTNYETVLYNQAIQDSLFEKPANPKLVK